MQSLTFRKCESRTLVFFYNPVKEADRSPGIMAIILITYVPHRFILRRRPPQFQELKRLPRARHVLAGLTARPDKNRRRQAEAYRRSPNNYLRSADQGNSPGQLV